MPTPARWRRAVEALASLRLSLFLFFALALTSVFGTVIQQQADPRAYVESYGPAVAKVLQALNLVDMYHSWWFELLLALLLVNTLVCSFRRLPAALRSIGPDQAADRESLRTKPFRDTWRAAEDASTAIEETLRRVAGSPRVSRRGEATLWFVQKQPWARLGPYVAHLSLVLFFLGALIGARFGFKGFVNIVEGEAATHVDLRSGETLQLPFAVGCEEFRLETYPDGRPKDYLSRLLVRRSGEVLQEKTIQVNDPLIQDGIFFYQSSYGRAGGGAVLRVLDRAGTPLLGRVTVPQEGSVVIPGTGLSLEVMATTENYQGFGPAAQVTLLATGRGGHSHVGEPFVVLQNHPDFDRRRNADQLVQLAELLPGRWYTGLQVAKDPGVPLIWAGSALITLGTLMSFFASHRRLWVLLENGEVTVAGVAAKQPDQFRGLFEELTQSLRDATEVQRQRERVCG